jgi:hypothetical protein
MCIRDSLLIYSQHKKQERILKEKMNVAIVATKREIIRAE